MDILGSLVGPILANPGVQAVLVGFITKYLVDRVKPMLAKVDQEGLPEGYKVPIRLAVAAATALVSAGDLALKGQLGLFDIAGAVNFVTIALPGMLTAMGVHDLLGTRTATLKKPQ
jgi:hypothetical protein